MVDLLPVYKKSYRW